MLRMIIKWTNEEDERIACVHERLTITPLCTWHLFTRVCSPSYSWVPCDWASDQRGPVWLSFLNSRLESLISAWANVATEPGIWASEGGPCNLHPIWISSFTWFSTIWWDPTTNLYSMYHLPFINIKTLMFRYIYRTLRKKETTRVQTFAWIKGRMHTLTDSFWSNRRACSGSNHTLPLF